MSVCLCGGSPIPASDMSVMITGALFKLVHLTEVHTVCADL